MLQSTLQDQWVGICANMPAPTASCSPQGTWEGNLSKYDADGNLAARQPTVLDVYVDSKEDEIKLSQGQQPSVLHIRLRRCTDQSDVDLSYQQGTDLPAKGMVYEPTAGHMCSGSRSLPLTGSVVEQHLNHRDNPSGPIRSRLRLITIFNAENLQRVALFRERPSTLPVRHTSTSVVPADAAAGDLVGTDTVATVQALCGTWRGTATELLPTDAGLGQQQRSYGLRCTLEDGGGLLVERDEDGVNHVMRGSVSENERSVTFWEREHAVSKLVFLGGGAMVHTSVQFPKGGSTELFFVELSWLVEPDLRMRVVRTFQGVQWIASSFRVERKV